MTVEIRPDITAPPRGTCPAAWHRTQLLSWLVPALLVAVWELFARLGTLPPYILPPPSKVAATGVALIQDGTLLPDMGISLLRAAAGFAIGGIVGFALGTAVGFSRIAGLLLDRTILMLRAIPFLAMLPLVIVWLGIGESAISRRVRRRFFNLHEHCARHQAGRPQAGGTRSRHRFVEPAIDSPYYPSWCANIDPQ